MTIESSIRLWVTASDWIEFDYAQARVEYAELGEQIRDRRGLVHWIRPNVPRYPTSLMLSVIPEELLRMNSSPGAPRSALEWLEYHFRSQTELLVFVVGSSLATGGIPVNRCLACRCRIRMLPPEIGGTLPVVGDYPDYLEIILAVHEDGTFADPAAFDSYQAYAPPRA